MTGRFRWFEVAGLVAALAIVATYGPTARGSDRAFGSQASREATLAFPLAWDPDAGYGSGRLQYVDSTAGISFFGVVRTAPVDSSRRLARLREFAGEYTPQPRGAGTGGMFHVAVFQNADSGFGKADTFEISLTGGTYDGYYYVGRLNGRSTTTPD
jgi:hypothetical protein